MTSVELVQTFCANCGLATPAVSVCPSCFRDPQLPSEFYSSTEAQRLDPVDRLLAVPGEGAALGIPLAIFATLLLFLSIATFGLLVFGLVAALFWLRVRQKRLRLDYTDVGPSYRSEMLELQRLAASRLQMRPVDMVVRQKLEPNASCAGFIDEHWIVLESGLFDYVKEPVELLFVLGHELGHIRRQHTTWLLLTESTFGSGIPLLGPLMRLVLNRWRLAAEYGADRAGLLACRDLKAAVQALARLHYWAEKVDLNQALRDDANELADPLTRIAEVFGSHPYFVNRVKRLTEFSNELEGKAK